MTSVLTWRSPPVVLVVDDVAANRDLLEADLVDLGYEVCQAADGVEALALIERAEPDLILLDIDMPRMDGLTLCRRVKAHPRQRLIPVVLITAMHDRKTRLYGREAGADDFLTKPVDAEELRARTRVLLRDRMLNLQLDGAESVILALARAVEARDLYTVHHAERVGRFAKEIGRAQGLADDDLTVIYRGGVVHDLGKAFVPSDILLKSGPLTEAEWEVMHAHSAIGATICEPLRSTATFLPIIRHHHERYDGRGYPDHLAAGDIPLGARIVAVADAWDAMVNDRPYRPSLGREEALRRLQDGAGMQWDPALAQLFIQLVEGGLVDHIAAEQLKRPLIGSGEADLER